MPGADETADIVTRLRQTRADMIGTDDEQHYWDCHDAANEIERLRKREELWDWCATKMMEMYGTCIRPEAENRP